jgi:murein L,D-transpeptidase YcbB/YkuD
MKKLKKSHLISIACLFLFLGTVQTPHAQDLPEKAASGQILVEAGMTQFLEAGRVNEKAFYDSAALKAFYEANNYKPVWSKASFFSDSKADKLLDKFENAWKHGLNPASYRVEEIQALMNQYGQEAEYQLDLILSDALIRYGHDLSAMRVDPRSIGQRAKYWREPLAPIDILNHVATHSNLDSALKGLEPSGDLYKKLQRELLSLYRTNPESMEFRQIAVDGLLRPGSSNKAVLSIRERLGFDPNSAPQGAYYYDDQLAQAVMAFQKGQGVKPDGIVGPQTVKLMNITREDRINQLLVNLERLRWVEPNKPERYVMVNVPSATLWAVDNNQVKLEMPVVVGRPKRPTNIFKTEITGIRFNPKWTVPPTIKRDDYLPKLREDPYYLFDRGIELVDKENMTVDPGLINWQEKTWAEVNQMRMIQGSGRSNPLGLVRVIMENPFNIYLHDTPTKSYFKRSNRALSSGCVRMAEPQKFADFVLAPNDNWSKERKDKILASGKEQNIWAHKPLPVYILYQTVWLGEQGQVVYGQDLYGHDAILLKELKKIEGLPVISSTQNRVTKEL